jgi:hypothetical protein
MPDVKVFQPYNDPTAEARALTIVRSLAPALRRRFGAPRVVPDSASDSEDAEQEEDLPFFFSDFTGGLAPPPRRRASARYELGLRARRAARRAAAAAADKIAAALGA